MNGRSTKELQCSPSSGPMYRSGHDDIYHQTLRPRAIPSDSREQISSVATSQEQGDDADKPRPYSGHRRFTGTLTPPGDVTAARRPTPAERKPRVCEHCGKTFNQTSDLKVHLRVHTGDKPFRCDQCGRGFTTSPALKVHLRVHAGDKPFCCGQCGWRFITSAALKGHLRIHTGEKPFVCEHCGRGFTHSGTLRNHRRVHTGETPFLCKRCGRSFKQICHLRGHLRRIHAVNSVKSVSE